MTDYKVALIIRIEIFTIVNILLNGYDENKHEFIYFYLY